MGGFLSHQEGPEIGGAFLPQHSLTWCIWDRACPPASATNDTPRIHGPRMNAARMNVARMNVARMNVARMNAACRDNAHCRVRCKYLTRNQIPTLVRLGDRRFFGPLRLKIRTAQFEHSCYTMRFLHLNIDTKSARYRFCGLLHFAAICSQIVLQICRRRSF